MIVLFRVTAANGLNIFYVWYFVSNILINNVCVRNVASLIIKCSADDSCVPVIIGTNVLSEVSSLQRSLKRYPAAEDKKRRENDRPQSCMDNWRIKDPRTST